MKGRRKPRMASALTPVPAATRASEVKNCRRGEESDMSYFVVLNTFHGPKGGGACDLEVPAYVVHKPTNPLFLSEKV